MITIHCCLLFFLLHHHLFLLLFIIVWYYYCFVINLYCWCYSYLSSAIIVLPLPFAIVVNRHHPQLLLLIVVVYSYQKVWEGNDSPMKINKKKQPTKERLNISNNYIFKKHFAIKELFKKMMCSRNNFWRFLGFLLWKVVYFCNSWKLAS
jgi:hypothetical protein